MYNFHGCLITSLISFQLILNYPCSEEEIYKRYTGYLKDELLFREMEDPQFLLDHPSIRTPLSDTTMPGFPGVIRTCSEYLRDTEFCKAFTKNETPYESIGQYLFLSGCGPLKLPLNNATCDFLNTFTEEKRRDFYSKDNETFLDPL